MGVKKDEPAGCTAINAMGRRCGRPRHFGEHCKRHHDIEQRIEPWSSLACKVARQVAKRRGQRLLEAFHRGRDGDLARAIAWSEMRKHDCPPELYEAIALAYWTP